MKRLLGLLLLLSLSAAASPIEVRRAPRPIAVDGVLEELWFDHAPPRDLRDHRGETSNLIVENYLTIFRTLWDDEYWYFSFTCSDLRPEGTLTRRDDPIYQEEMCEIMIHSPSGRYLYELSISPHGTLYDARLAWNSLNRFDVDTGWNFEGVKSAVKITPLPDAPGRTVWVVELAIPWSALPEGRPAPGTTIRANALRYERLRPPRHRELNLGQELLALSLFPTGIKAWPQGPSTPGLFLFK